MKIKNLQTSKNIKSAKSQDCFLEELNENAIYNSSILTCLVDGTNPYLKTNLPVYLDSLFEVEKMLDAGISGADRDNCVYYLSYFTYICATKVYIHEQISPLKAFNALELILFNPILSYYAYSTIYSTLLVTATKWFMGEQLETIILLLVQKMHTYWNKSLKNKENFIQELHQMILKNFIEDKISHWELFKNYLIKQQVPTDKISEQQRGFINLLGCSLLDIHTV